jgi:two-component system response regulator YesN
MEAAKELLKSPDLKILDISEMVGYENSTYFSTVFKKYTGMHPQKFRTLFTLPI